jgi:hypothetical protein
MLNLVFVDWLWRGISYYLRQTETLACSEDRLVRYDRDHDTHKITRKGLFPTSGLAFCYDDDDDDDDFTIPQWHSIWDGLFDFPSGDDQSKRFKESCCVTVVEILLLFLLPIPLPLPLPLPSLP